MSGESIFGLYAKGAAAEKQHSKSASPYTGEYDKHMGEPTKPVYSTFFEKGKEYDGTNVRFFKQREAIIGKSVSDSVDPQNYLKKGGGVRHVVPPVREDKLYCNPPVDGAFNGGGAGKGLRAPLRGDKTGIGGNREGPAGGYGTRGAGEESGDGDFDGQGDPSRSNAGFHNAAEHDGLIDSRNATKNFVASNIVEASNTVPKRRKEQAPLATSRKSFGQAPAYLSRVKGEVAEEKAFVESLEIAKSQRQQQAFARYVYLLPHEEHMKLVADLKMQHDECLAELQKMPFSKDTVTMHKRKTELERTISDIEVALKKLDKDALFVYKDDPVNGQWTKEAALKEAQKYASESL